MGIFTTWDPLQFKPFESWEKLYDQRQICIYAPIFGYEAAIYLANNQLGIAASV